MCTVFAIEIPGVIQRCDSEGVDGTPPGWLDFQRAHLMNSQRCDAKTTHWWQVVIYKEAGACVCLYIKLQPLELKTGAVSVENCSSSHDHLRQFPKMSKFPLTPILIFQQTQTWTLWAMLESLHPCFMFSSYICNCRVRNAFLCQFKTDYWWHKKIKNSGETPVRKSCYRCTNSDDSSCQKETWWQ